MPGLQRSFRVGLVLSAACYLLPLSVPFEARAQVQSRKAGVIIPLSGPMADWGRSIQIGVEFGAQRSGSGVQYIFEDEAACDATKALSAAQKLLSVDKVDVLMTGCLNGTRAILPVAQKAGALVVSLGLVNEEFAAQSKDSLITPSASITAESEGISSLLKADGKHKLAVLRVEDNFTEEIMSGLKRYAARDGWALVADERLTFNSTDFRSSLLNVARSGADAVLIYTSTEQVLTAVRQLKELKINSLGVYAGYVVEADPPPPQDLASLGGVRCAAAVTPVNDELSAFLQAKGSKETFQTRVAADAVADLTKAFTRCLEPSGFASCVRASITSRTWQDAAFSGGFFYDQNGLASRTVRGKVVQNGRYEWDSAPFVR